MHVSISGYKLDKKFLIADVAPWLPLSSGLTDSWVHSLRQLIPSTLNRYLSNGVSVSSSRQRRMHCECRRQEGHKVYGRGALGA